MRARFESEPAGHFSSKHSRLAEILRSMGTKIHQAISESPTTPERLRRIREKVVAEAERRRDEPPESF